MAVGTMGPTRDLGPAICTWGTTDISEIFEEVRLTLNSAEAGKVYEAISGGTPVDTIISGYSECIVTIPATRTTLALMKTLLPGGTNSGGASGFVGINPSLVTGKSAYDDGLPLLIKPIVAGVAAANGTWMRLEHTYPQPSFEVIFDLKTQRVYGLSFAAHPDATNGLLWSAGKVPEDPSY